MDDTPILDEIMVENALGSTGEVHVLNVTVVLDDGVLANPTTPALI